MVFASREDAGEQLARLLIDRGVRADVVLGLPRGGVVVAALVARALQAPLDVLIVRKIGHPLFREFAVGALGEGGVTVLDPEIFGSGPIVRDLLHEVILEESTRLKYYQLLFHQGEGEEISGKSVLLVDDGLATGATTEAAVRSARKRGAVRVQVAAPVASTGAVERLEQIADEVIVTYVDPDFDAVGRYYTEFPQTSDAEVVSLLKAA